MGPVLESDRKKAMAMIRSFIEETFAGKYDIYDICLKPVNRRLLLQVLLDSSTGIKVSDCEAVSRSLSHYLDEVDLIHQSYTLEVSSPGAERKLKRNVDYERQIGRLVRWVLRADKDAPKEVFQARLHEFSPNRILVSAEKGLREFPLAIVEEAKVILEFPRKVRG
ncbi:ribosome maturation factor RimP [bacterium]|nr:ribosome maturation factor RimP [bacterium]